MNREQQIEEMAEFMLNSCRSKCFTDSLGYTDCNFADCEMCTATDLYNAGYRKQSGWISVDGRFPDEMGEYLVSVQIYGKTHVTTAHFTPYSSRISWIECGVTHWMPLPELPRMESEEQI